MAENFDITTNENEEEFVVDFGEVTRLGGGGTSDFNNLTNRPQYNNETMTGDTNIPEVPSKTSDLDNDSNYQTGSEVEDAISAALDEIEIPTKTSELQNDGADGTSTYVEADDLASVATSGSYDDLADKPTIPTIPSDFIGTDGVTAGTAGLVPAPATTDADKFLKSDGTWATAGGGGGSITPVQTTGTSTTDVMSQDAATKMLFPDITNQPRSVHIGGGSVSSKCTSINGTVYNDAISSIAIGASDGYAEIGGNGRARYCIAIGDSAAVGKGTNSIAIGYNTYCYSGSNNTGRNTVVGSSSKINGNITDSVALGANAKATRIGEVNVGTGGNYSGFNSTDYRVIGGVHDGQDAHDVVTVGQVNAMIDAINAALSTNIPHIGAV